MPDSERDAKDLVSMDDITLAHRIVCRLRPEGWPAKEAEVARALCRHRLTAEAERATREEALEEALLEMALLEIAEGQHVDVFEKGRLVLRPYNPAEIARAALDTKGAAS